MTRHVFAGVGLDDADDAVVERTEGWFNVVYVVRLADGREAVLKIAPPPGAEVMTYERDLMATEVACMRLAASNPAIPVPLVLGADDSLERCDAPYVFMERRPGEVLSSARDALAPEEVAALHRQVGRIVRELHGITGPWFGYPGHPGLRADDWPTAFERIVGSVLDDAVARDVDLGHPVDDLRATVRRHHDDLAEVTTPRLVHWDLWDPNVLVRDGEVTGVIDFERCLWGDPLMEAQFRPFFGPGVTAPMEGYGRTSFTPAEERRCDLYTMHLGLVIVTECAYRHYDTDEAITIGRRVLGTAMERLTAGR